METNDIIRYAAAGAVGLLGLFAQESVKEVIKKFFSGLGRTGTNVVFFALLGGLVFLTYYSINITTDQKATAPITEVPAEEPLHAKSDAVVYVEAGLEITKEGLELLEKKQKRDSIRLAQRKKVWVYQVGFPMGEDEVWETFEKLSSVSNLYAFKESKRDYRLIIDNRYNSEEEAKNALEEVRSKIGAIESRIEIIDLWSFCSKREELKTTSPLSKRKKGFKIPCYICN